MKTNITDKSKKELVLGLAFVTALVIPAASLGQGRNQDNKSNPKQIQPAHARRDNVKTTNVPPRTNPRADQGLQRGKPPTPPKQNPPVRQNPPTQKNPPQRVPAPQRVPPLQIPINTSARTTQRNFTRTNQGRRYDTGIALRPSTRVTSTWQRPYFPQGRLYYPYYQPSYNSASVFISPFGFYFGINAPYISRSHGYIRRPSVTYIEIPMYNGVNYNGYQNYNGDNYFNDTDLGRQEPGLLNAVDEIQEGFRNGNIDSLVALTDPNTDIAIYLNGQYSYSMPSNDYLDLARDAMDSTRTVQFNLTMLHKRSNGVFVVSGQHVYRDQNGRNRSVYVSYVLEDIQGMWTITQVGTTPDRLQNWN